MELAKLRVSKLQRKGNHAYISNKAEEVFECQFNPTEFQITKTNNWVFQPSIGGNVERSSFSGGQAQDLTITLLFDANAPAEPNKTQLANPQARLSEKKVESVVKKYEKLRKLANIEEDKKVAETDKGEPPWVLVQWGTLIQFVAVITQFSEKYLLFAPDGTPIRAEVTFTVKESVDETKKLPQNPTSASDARKTVIVQQGQRLDWLAYEEYGDAAAWRHIAKTNNLLNPKTLRSGQILRLTPLE